MRAKKSAKLNNLSREMWLAIGFFECLWRLYTTEEFLITSGEDTAKGRKSNTKHKLNEEGECEAIDGSIKGLDRFTQFIILGYARRHLDPLGYDTVIHKVKDGVRHLHCEWDPKKGEILIRR